MYNERYKMDYIKSEHKDKLDTYIQVINYYFEKSEEFEENLGKDLSNFTVFEIISMYKSFLSKSLETLTNINSLFSNYTRYMLSQNLIKDNQNHYDEIDEKILLTCVNKKNANAIVSREDLLQDLKKLNNPSDQFLMLGLFEGLNAIGNNDFENLNMKNIDGDIIHLPKDRKFKISRELINYGLESSDEYKLYTYENKGGATSDYRKLDPTDKNIIKRKMGWSDNDSATLKRQRIYSQLTRARKWLDNNPAYTNKNLTESGRVDYIKNLCKIDKNNNIRLVILNHKKEIEERYGKFSSDSVKRYLLKYGEYFY